METLITAFVVWTIAVFGIGIQVGRYLLAGAIAEHIEAAYERGVEDARRPLPELGLERGDDNCNDVNPSYARRFWSPWLEEMP